VAQAAVKLGIAPQLDDAELLARAEKWRWTPEYATLSLR
jgi:hypothetical protein